MTDATIFIILAVVAFVAVAAIIFMRGISGVGQRLSPLAGIAFAFVVAGIVFGDDRVLGYSLIGVGVAIAAGDMIIKGRRGRS
jgi:hypothetical protein